MIHTLIELLLRLCLRDTLRQPDQCLDAMTNTQVRMSYPISDVKRESLGSPFLHLKSCFFIAMKTVLQVSCVFRLVTTVPSIVAAMACAREALPQVERLLRQLPALRAISPDP